MFMDTVQGIVNFVVYEGSLVLHSCVYSVALLCPTLRDPIHGLWPARLLCPQDFFRQEYCSGLPFPPLGDLTDPGIELVSLTSPALASGFFMRTCSVMSESLQPCGL